MRKWVDSARPWSLIVGVLLAALVAALPMQYVTAQSSDDAAKLAGRLGGTLDEMQQRFGPPSWTDESLIGYNSQILAGVDTIVVVYYDDRNIVDKISLVYLSKPAAFATGEDIAKTVAEVAPADGLCSVTPLPISGMGREVYACQSSALASAVSAEMMTKAGVRGTPGSYNYSVDPTVDDYYEIVIRPGTDTDTPPPTPVPTTAPQPTAAPSLTDKYPPVQDVRELAIGRGFSEGDKLSVSGEVFNLEVDEEGTYMQIWVNAPDGSTEAVMIGYPGDTTGLFEGMWVTAYGTYVGRICGTNAFGGEICQPAIFADVVEY